MRKSLFFLFALLLAITSCKKQNHFVGEWELDSLTLQGDIITAEDLGNPLYTFTEDNTYKIEVTGLKQEGTWELDGEDLILVDNETPGVENVLHIVEANEYKFHYKAGEVEPFTEVVLKRANK